MKTLNKLPKYTPPTSWLRGRRIKRARPLARRYMSKIFIVLGFILSVPVVEAEECKLPEPVPKTIPMEPARTISKGEAIDLGFYVRKDKLKYYDQYYLSFSEMNLCTVTNVTAKMSSGSEYFFESKLAIVDTDLNGNEIYIIKTARDQKSKVSLDISCCDDWSGYRINL